MYLFSAVMFVLAAVASLCGGHVEVAFIEYVAATSMLALHRIEKLEVSRAA